MSQANFTHRTLPVIGKRVLRMGLAPSFGIDAAGIDWALADGDMQYVFWTPRMKAATDPLKRALNRDRERYVVATGPTTAWTSHGIRKAVDRSRSLLGRSFWARIALWISSRVPSNS